ncbi:MAG: hypothetical protein V4447_11800 [Pseudomonadota bacterium]
MATASIKKIASPVKAPIVPGKKIATAAAKVRAVKPALKAKPQAAVKAPAAVVLKPALPVKAATKPATKLATKPAIKPVTKSATKPATKPVAKKLDKAAAKPVAATVTTAQAKEKVKKAKLVRDSFTMPEAEYAVLSHVKKACLSAGIEAKKSQLLRVGLLLLSKTDVASLKTLIANLEPLKAGRPKKDK